MKDLFRDLTVGEALALNEAARLTCEFEITSQTGEDMFIAELMPRCIDGSWDYDWNGLFIELKKEGTRLKKKSGEWASEHIAEQAKMLGKLRARGYRAEFARGFDEAKSLIDDYFFTKGFKE